MLICAILNIIVIIEKSLFGQEIIVFFTEECSLYCDVLLCDRE